MRRFLILLLYDFKLAVRDRQNLAFSFALPVLLMTLLGLAFGGGAPFFIHIGVVDNDRSELTRASTEAIAEIDGIRLHEGNEASELAALRRGERTAIVVFPGGFQFGTIGFQTNLVFYEDETDPQNSRLALTVVRNVLSELQSKVSEQEFALDRRPVRGIRFRYLDFMTPGILGMAVMNLGVLGAIGTLVGYRERGILRRVRATPTPLWAFIGGQALVRLGLSAVQVVLIIGIATLGFDVDVTGSFGALLVLAVVGSAVFVNLGIIASSVASTFQTAQTVGLIVTVPMIFICGVFFPIDAMPGFLKPLIQVLPLTHLNTALREVLTRSGTLQDVSTELTILGGLAVASFFVALKAFRWE